MGARSKLDYARVLAAALAFVMVRQGDSVGLVVCDDEIRDQLAPSSTMGGLLTLLEHLERREAGGETALAPVLEVLAEQHRRRGLVILITDALDDPRNLVRALRHLRHRRQDVRLFHIVDPAERSFPFQGAHEFLGLEHEPKLRLDGDRARRYYREQLALHQEQLDAGCHAAGIQVVRLSTDDDLALALARALTAMVPVRGTRR